MSSIRPFTFSNLKRMTRAQVALEASATKWFGGRSLARGLAADLAAVLQKYLGDPCQVLPPDTKSVARRDLATVLPATGCFVVVGAAPGDAKILVEIDLGLASFAIERLLGGTGESDRILRPLTDVEEGVLSFLLLEVLASFTVAFETGKELVLTLDRFLGKLDDAQPFVDAESDFVLLGTRVSAGKHVGYARIVLPGSLVTERFGKPVPQGGPPGRSTAQALLEGIADIAVTARVELARLPDLSADDVAQLEPGDIIVVEGHEVARTPEGLEGTVVVKLGAGLNGGLRCRLLPGDSQRLEIVEIVVQEHPAEDAMAEQGAEGSPGAGAETPAGAEGLLRDVPAPVVVELGRIRMSAAQVVRLEKGQVLRLPRAPADPVDLVVNGKVLARGELVDVEGELGVRLVQIVGAG